VRPGCEGSTCEKQDDWYSHCAPPGGVMAGTEANNGKDLGKFASK